MKKFNLLFKLILIKKKVKTNEIATTLIKREIRKPKYFMEQDQAVASKIHYNNSQDNLSILAATASTQNSHLSRLLSENMNKNVSIYDLQS